MSNSEIKWIVVSDFDGTITREDIGNALCKEVIPKKFEELHARYRMEDLTLLELQEAVWNDFPMSENQFIESSLKYGELNYGVDKFFKFCSEKRIPIYVASCGIRPYIEAVLEDKLDDASFNNIADIQCNDAQFSDKQITKFLAVTQDSKSYYSFDKGQWCDQLRKNHGPHCKIIGIGNGTSDRSFVGHVDILAATDALAIWCHQNEVQHINFTDMSELLTLEPFQK